MVATNSSNPPLHPIDMEIKRTISRNRRRQDSNQCDHQMKNLNRTVNEQEEVAGNNGNLVNANANSRYLRDYAIPNFVGASSGIARLPMQVNNIEIKPALIQMLQIHVMFGGGSNKDPYKHLIKFGEVINTFWYNGVYLDCIRMRAFPFSLRDRVRSWLQ
ncbi:hypothetical protein ACH5RR_029580 [Cinchona calisaya]|uniref:Uncharacterized protein n=1 Tax=Cinchona calisaya TaxID=153742 RepID=A0ABD2YS24_9GENT